MRIPLLSFIAGGLYGAALFFGFGVRAFDGIGVLIASALGAGGIGAAIGLLTTGPIHDDEPVRRARAERGE